MPRNLLFPDTQAFTALPNREKINTLLTAASLAPSTVNTQPWLFSVYGDSISIYLNPKRKLPVSDSTGRQAYISLGASCANLELLAQSYGMEFAVHELTPTSTNAPIAKFSIQNYKVKGDHPEIRNALSRRHTNRFPFEKKLLPQNFAEKIKKISSDAVTVHIVEDEETKNRLTPLVLDAIFEVFSKKDWSYELSFWIKPSLAKYEDGMPGYYLGIPKLLSFLMPFVLRYSSVAKKQLKNHAEMLKWVSAYGIITASENTPITWFRIGQIFERIAIEAEIQNIKIGILTAPTEIQTYAKQIKNILHTQETPQMFFRMGYTEKKPIFSPRLSIKDIIKN